MTLPKEERGRPRPQQAANFLRARLSLHRSVNICVAATEDGRPPLSNCVLSLTNLADSLGRALCYGGKLPEDSFCKIISVEVTVQLPDDIAKHLGETSTMPRQMLEAFAAEAYRTLRLSRRQLSQLLGLDYWQTEDFLTHHDAKRPFTLADLEIDRQSLAGLPLK